MSDYRDELFEWDEQKSADTRKRRGFDFKFASQIFEVDYVEAFDEAHSDDEDRVYCIGIADGYFLTVVYTWRENRKRILSAWQSEREDIDEYTRQIGKIF